jgi:hypothetical protein
MSAATAFNMKLDPITPFLDVDRRVELAGWREKSHAEQSASGIVSWTMSMWGKVKNTHRLRKYRLPVVDEAEG